MRVAPASVQTAGRPQNDKEEQRLLLTHASGPRRRPVGIGHCSMGGRLSGPKSARASLGLLAAPRSEARKK